MRWGRRRRRCGPRHQLQQNYLHVAVDKYLPPCRAFPIHVVPCRLHAGGRGSTFIHRGGGVAFGFGDDRRSWLTSRSWGFGRGLATNVRCWFYPGGTAGRVPLVAWLAYSLHMMRAYARSTAAGVKCPQLARQSAGRAASRRASRPSSSSSWCSSCAKASCRSSRSTSAARRNGHL